MKFVKKANWYESENGRYEIVKYAGRYEVYDNKSEQPVYKAGKVSGYTRKYLGRVATLKEAKELCK